MRSDSSGCAGYLELSTRVHQWCLRSLERAERRGDLEHAARWAWVAADTAHQTALPHLCSVPLEQAIARLSACLPAARNQRPRRGRRRWLHVLSSTSLIGGHTAFIRRWVQKNPHGEAHDLLMTLQAEGDVEPGLAAAIRRSGGRVASLSGRAGLLEKARMIREAAAASDVVVLTVHQQDVAAALAFAGTGGPPVLLVNHQDHAFWLGAGSVDQVVDFRTSGRHLTEHYRGVPASVELPVPLDDDGPAAFDRRAIVDRVRFGAGPGSGPWLLTIGRSLKYSATARLDFMDTVARILRARPDARLVAVGPRPSDAGWGRLEQMSGGRVCAVGEHRDLRPWHAAADLYLEGFPIGSYTALLEVALGGRAIIRKPLLVPPEALPIDQGALADNPAPCDPAAYAESAIRAIDDPEGRRRQAEANRDAVLRHHCGAAWDDRLSSLCEGLPQVHEPRVPAGVPDAPPALSEYWMRFRQARRARDPFMLAYLSALGGGVGPRVDAPLFKALGDARAAAVLSTGPSKALVGSWGLSILPSRLAKAIYQALP